MQETENEAFESVEVVGRTVDEAVQKGLEVLKLRRDQVNLEILSDGARTFFGFRPGQVRVRLSPKEAPVETKAPPTEEVAETEETPAPRDTKAEAFAGRAILSELLKRMGIPAQVMIEEGSGDEPVILNIKGKNLGMLIGRRGETLASIQFLTRLMVSHQLERWVNLVVDVDDYRRKREETLQRLSQRMAQLAIETGQVQELEPMAPAERRIVHLALRDFPGVTTQSVGEGESRRVTIVPGQSSQS